MERSKITSTRCVYDKTEQPGSPPSLPRSSISILKLIRLEWHFYLKKKHLHSRPCIFFSKSKTSFVMIAIHLTACLEESATFLLKKAIREKNTTDSLEK